MFEIRCTLCGKRIADVDKPPAVNDYRHHASMCEAGLFVDAISAVERWLTPERKKTITKLYNTGKDQA